MKKTDIFFLSAANSIHTVRWVNALKDSFTVHLIYCKGHGPKIDKIDKSIILHELKVKAPFGYYLNYIELKNLYKQIKPVVVNAHYASGYGTLARLAKIKPLLLSVWGSDVYDFPKESIIKNKIFKKNVLSANYIASTSNAMAEELKKNVDIGDRQIFITPFGVDIEKFKKMNVEREIKEFRIGNVKKLEPKYGIEYTILAVKQLKQKLIENDENDLADSIKLYIYGDGEQREELEQLIIDKKLEKTVFLMGKISNEEVPKVLNSFDVFCASSILNSESFGVAVVEAMACELPVIATKVDGFCEVMEDNVTGILVDKKDINQIAQAIEKLLRNKELRTKYGKAGRTRVMEKYNWKDNVKYMISTYNKIFNENDRRKI